MSKLIFNGKVFTLGSEKVEMIENGAIAIDNDLIIEVGKSEDLLKKYSSAAEQIDAKGMLVLPGFVCAHGHFYGMYSRGMSLCDDAPAGFLEVLERLWWRLDRALDAESNYMGALILSIEGLRAGTTCIVDHHASPNHITGSLDEIAKATTELGIRSCLCYEVTDRNGLAGAQEGIDENIRFMRKCAAEPNPLLGATFGVHASFTVCDDTLKKSVDAIEAFRKDFPGVNAGMHIHVAEGEYDEEACRREHGKSCIQRLKDAGALGPNTIVGHGVFLTDEEIDTIAETKTMIVTNPESNMNNAVGIPRLLEFLKKGVLVGLGTDGMTYDMLQEYRASCLIHKLMKKDPRVATMESFNLLFRNNSLIASKFFAHPVGRLEPGCYADILFVNYVPPTPINAGNFPWQLHFGIASADVDTVFVGGKKIMEGRKILTVDTKAKYEQSFRETPQVWAKFEQVVKEDKAKKN